MELMMPALATATIGIAMGAAGTDVTMEMADVVLMSDNLRNNPFTISLSRRAHTVIWQNLAIAISVMVVPMASTLGFALPLTLGVVGHEGSTVLVCLNGLRLLAFRPQRRELSADNNCALADSSTNASAGNANRPVQATISSRQGLTSLRSLNR
jgi:hypothetical protein